MANKKKENYKPKPMTEGKRNIIQGLLQEYNIETAADIQEALKDLLGGTIKEMMEAEMDEHLGYEKSQRSDSDDARNGYKSKHITTSYGGMEIEVPQDRKSTFEPQVVKKRQKDISEIDQKIISMHTKRDDDPADIRHTHGHLRIRGIGRLHIRRDGQAAAADRGVAEAATERGISGRLH